MRVQLRHLHGKAKAALAGLFLVFLLSAGLFTWLMVDYNSRVMRSELIQQTQIFSRMIEMDQLTQLTGSSADLESAAYYQLKEQLSRVVASIPKCRFAYLTGMRSDGTVYFYVDNEPVGSEDESPPGQVYHEASEAFKSVFSDGSPMTEGPYDDRWGTWVTALVPLIDTETGKVVAVFGVDIASADWKWEIAARSAFPIALFVVFGVVLFSIFYYRRPSAISSKPVLRRLLWPLMIIITLIVCGFVTLLWWQQNFLLQKSIEHAVYSVPRHFDQMVKIYGDGILKETSFLTEDRDLQRMMADGDQELLLKTYQPLAQEFQQNDGIEYISFLDAGRRCLVSFHNAQTDTDESSICLMLEEGAAESAITGLGVSPSGALVLKVMRPIFFGREAVGHIIFGKDLGGVLKEIREPDIDLAIILRKEFVNRDTWQRERAIADHEISWDLFSEYILVSAPVSIKPQKILQIVDKYEHYSLKEELAIDGQIWRVSLIPLYAPSGDAIGDLVVLYDISKEKMAFRRMIFVAGGVLAVVLTLLFSFLFILLRWTDQGILEGERLLRESEARFQSVVSNVPGVIFRCRNNANWTMEFISDRIGDIVGYPADEFIDDAVRSYQSIIHPDDQDRIAQEISTEVGGARRPYVIDYRVCTAEGQVKWIRESGRGFFSESGDVLYIDGVIIDITPQKKIEEEMREIQEQLTQSEKMAAVGKLSAGVAHEIKNPLAIILLSIDALEPEVSPEGNARRLVGMIRTSAKRANKIIIDLLNFSRQLKPKVQPVYPRGLIEAAVSAVSIDAANQNIMMEQQHGVPDGIMIDADPVLMQHGFLNIFQNAFDAMPNGGKVMLETGLEEAAVGQPQRVWIRIADDGCGIPPEIIDGIFEPFMTTKEIGKGTGLGLSLTYAIIERHQGTISVESTPGVGTVFTILLPCWEHPKDDGDRA